MNEKIVYGHTMDALLHVLGEPLTAEQSDGLRALGVHPRERLPAYPVEQYTRVVDFIGAQLWSGLPQDEARYELGRAFMRAYQQTPMGSAVSAVSRFIGPQRALERMATNFRSANNYTETRLSELAPGHYELWMNHGSHAHYIRGLLTEALTRSGGREVSVTLLAMGEARDATFRVRWNP